MSADASRESIHLAQDITFKDLKMARDKEINKKKSTLNKVNRKSQ